MRYFLFFISIITLNACNTASTDQQADVDDSTKLLKTDSTNTFIYHFADTALEQKITSALRKLPFIVKSNNYIDSISSHQHGIAFILSNPEENETEIAVQAGYNGNERFETYYRFFVNPETLEIKVYDPVENEKLTLKAFLKRQP